MGNYAGTCFARLSLAAPVVIAGLAIATEAHAKPLANGGKLLLTRGVSSIEGSGGGGLATWALITGNETEDGIGASAFATYVPLQDYEFRAAGAAIGFYDRVEVSYARQQFDTGSTGTALGLGDGFTFEQDVISAKVRILGDAVYDQDRLMPQVAIGFQYKKNNRTDVIRAVGGKKDKGVDYFASATKVLLAQSLLLNGTLRYTQANQTGLLGFGGDRNDDYSMQAEFTAAYMFSKRLIAGVEYRSKPDNLGFAKENDAIDLFAAYAITRNLTATMAYVDLGDIATRRNQHGAYFSLQVGF